jgi:hypothetical protein
MMLATARSSAMKRRVGSVPAVTALKSTRLVARIIRAFAANANFHEVEAGQRRGFRRPDTSGGAADVHLQAKRRHIADRLHAVDVAHGTWTRNPFVATNGS